MRTYFHHTKIGSFEYGCDLAFRITDNLHSSSHTHPHLCFPAGEIPGVDAHDRLPCPSLGPVGEEPFSCTPSLPRPVEDYQKSLDDLIEAADRASSLFGEVRSICRRATPTPSETPCTPSTSISHDILTLSRTYQRLMPGTLQTVQRLADEAAACRLPCNKAVTAVDNDSLNNFNPGIGDNLGPICFKILAIHQRHPILNFVCDECT